MWNTPDVVLASTSPHEAQQDRPDSSLAPEEGLQLERASRVWSGGRETLRSTLEVLTVCEGFGPTGVLTFQGKGRASGDIVLAAGRVCLVNAGGRWAANFRRNHPQGGDLLNRLLARTRSGDRSFEEALETAGEWMLERFRSAMLEESARNLIALASDGDPTLTCGPVGVPEEIPGWDTEWRPAHPSYLENLTFSTYEVYEEVVRLLQVSELRSMEPSTPSRAFESCRLDCRLALLVLTDPETLDDPLLLKAAGEPMPLTTLCDLSHCVARIAAPPSVTLGSGAHGPRYLAFGPVWNRCLVVSEGPYHVVLVSDEPAARARIAQRVFRETHFRASEAR